MSYVTMTTFTEVKYSVQAIRSALGIDRAITPPSAREAIPVTNSETNGLIAKIAAFTARVEPSLMAGNWEKQPNDPDWMPGYESQSDADLALAGRIARIAVAEGAKPAELAAIVEEVFGMSGLARRDKWQSRADYRDRTISKAISGFNIDMSPSEIVISGPSTRQMYGDVLNGHKFAEYWRGRMIFVTTLNKWLKWSGA